LGVLALAVAWVAVAAFLAELRGGAQQASNMAWGAKATPRRGSLPPRAAQAQRFLAQRGLTAARAKQNLSGSLAGDLAGRRAGLRTSAAPLSKTGSTTAGSASWISVGPAAVETPTYGLVSGRISSLALDPSDAAGNRLYVGTTGGGVWLSVNAGTSAVSDVVFNPLTDTVVLANGEPYASQIDSSISIAALTVQPGGGCATGGTGVILTGTGDPNDALDSYYGAGVLRSTDCGTTWSLIQTTADQSKTFVGEGFAGFAWAAPNPVSGSFISSKVNQNLVVAAVSQAYEGALVNAEIANDSYEGLYYSTDSGATWTLATITDGNGADVEGAADTFDYPHGNAATAVVWNAVRQIFVAAVRYHGYYQSTDGITFTRLGVQSGTAQPGTNLTTRLCPTNLTTTGSEACPIFRGALAVDPESGDTFAWTVDISNQDQGLWRDRCAITSSGACTNTAIAFATQLSTAALETDDPEWGEYTIENGDYNLALAAVPTELDSEADTILLAGANDLWRCSLADSCTWRNTTNATSCMSAKVGEFQHALEWNAANPEEIFIGNDSGLWRSMDAVNESPAGAPEPVCSSTDASHFQNLNGELGSLAESVSLAQSSSNPYAMMTGLGVNGSAGVRDSAQPSGDWPQILSGEGGPTAIDPSGNDWYVNSEAGVFIQKCSQPSAACTAADFGTAAVVDMNARLEDGSTMSVPAPFIVDPLDPTYLLVGTCRVWRVPGDGSGWSASNAVSSILDGGDETYCAGNALIRSIAAMALPVSNALPQGGEVVYVGMYGAENGGEGESLLPGHVLSATIDPSSRTLPVWTDLTSDAVSNDSKAINALELDFSSIAIDPHDPTGQTVYVTVEGVSHALAVVQPVYRSIDGGATWASISSNLPASPVSSLVVDPQDANTVYVATDVGVYSTRTVTSCARSSCWSAFGAGLPEAPVVALSASSATASAQLLTAATYGRGIWQTPLWTAGEQLTTVTATPNSLTFTTPQSYGTTSAAQTVTLKNTGSYALTVSAIAMSGDFSETDTCQNATVSAGASCTIQVSFTPDTNGTLTGEMTISANMSGGEVAVTLSGTGTAAPQVNLAPAAVSFGGVALGNSSTLQVTANNGTGSAIPYASTITGPFAIASSTCVSSLGVAEIPAGSCNLMVQFIPSAAGAATGTLTFTDSAGTQQVALSGSGLTATTDTLSATSLTFPGTVLDQLSAVETVSLTNSGGAALTSIATAASGPFTATNNCSRNLAAASSCTISVFFLPTAAGAASGTLTVTDSASDSPKTVALSGTGLLAPAFTVSPASLSFGIVAVGSSNTQTLKITNTGGAPMANVSFQISGTSASSFATGTTTCGATLAGGSSCTVPVTYTPTASSGSTAMLAISSSTLGVSAATVDLTGNQGEFPASIEVTPTTISFSATGINESSNSKTVTIANPGTSASLSNLTLAVTSGFNLVNNTCAALVSGTLAAQSNCTVGVVFAPASTGAQTGTLTISSSTVTVAATVALSGMGTDFTVAISGATSQTVAKGQTADYSLKITPLGGAQATYAFQCGSLPSNALCLFSPSSETLSGSATGNVTVEISTGQSSASAVKPGPDSRSGRGGALPLLCGVLALPLVWKLHRKAFMAVALLAILAGGVSSCSGSGGGTSGGGGSGGGGTSGGTPAGTYSIPVTVSCNGVQHSVTMTLIVD
jgi:hypothetical protein